MVSRGRAGSGGRRRGGGVRALGRVEEGVEVARRLEEEDGVVDWAL